MKKVIVRGFYSVMLVAFILWMIFSTPVIVRSRNTGLEIYEEAPVQQEQMGESFWNLEQIEQTDAFYDTFTFSGAIYSLSTSTDEEATRSMVFAGKKKSYRIQLSERSTFWVNQFADIDPMPKPLSGFKFSFSTLAMDNDEYKLLLQIEENGIPVSRADTGYVIEKINGYATLAYKPSVQVEEPQNPVGVLSSGLTSATKLLPDGTLNIEGWGNIADDIDASEVESIVGVSGNYDDSIRYYSTVKKGTFYLAELFKNDNYRMAGFIASVPNMTVENQKIYLYAKYRGEIYRCPYHYEPDGEGWFNIVYDEVHTLGMAGQ